MVNSRIVAGATTYWDDSATTDHAGNAVQSDVYALKYSFRGPAKVDINAVPNGTGWRTTVTPTTFTVAGVYYWQAIASRGDPVNSTVVFNSGSLEVLPNLAGITADTYDGRTVARKGLEQVQAAISALALSGVKSYMIGTRSVTKMDLPDLIALETKYRIDVAREERSRKKALGQLTSNNLLVRFRKSRL